MINKNIAVLCGGWSEERLISLKSGDSVYKCLKENGYEVSKIDVKTASEAFNKELYSEFDLVFILLHGRGGEDGEIQKFFEENDIVFTGSNSQSSRITMNKIMTKEIWKKNNIKTPEYFIYEKNFLLDNLSSFEKWVIKPNLEGSSNGISFYNYFEGKEDFQKKINLAKKFDDSVLIERFIDGKEITVPIINKKCLRPIHIIPEGEFYDFDAKYVSNNTKYLEYAIESERLETLNNLAINAYELVGAENWGRIDIIDDGIDYFLIELNSVPGMTETSLVPKSSHLSGISYLELLESIMDDALAKKA
ncbi:D-alanine--D-alanine ligase [SAR86 cluster bacterium]|nr:D-alanine--D-alanine ligase [SAR86 cluster bacterium]